MNRRCRGAWGTGLRLGTLALLALGLWTNPALAQVDPIPLIVGPPQDVAGGPQFAAVGDLNDDGYGDMVVSTDRNEHVITLISAGDGSIQTLMTYPVGRRLGDLALGDFNDDDILDVAVIDERGGVFTLSGIGDGRFEDPTFYAGTGQSQAVAVADVDRRNGPDILTANGTDNSISVFLNRGQNRGFEPSVEYAMGGKSRLDDIEVTDINGDGFADVIVADSELRDNDEVTVMMNNGLAQYLQVFSFTVDDGSTALTTGDYNDDGKIDIATINVGDLRTSVRRSYTVSILLGNGAGIFQVLRPVEFTCPGRYNAKPIVCIPQDIVSADFNRDGYDDLAASVETRTEQYLGVETPGIVDALVSRGDGSFALSTTLQVGLRPRGLGVGDMTGDYLPDLAVTEHGRVGIGDTDDTVTIVRAVNIERWAVGPFCRSPNQCISNVCLHGFCCEFVCPGMQRCDVPGKEGSCSDPSDNGDACTDGAQCMSGNCVYGACCQQPGCTGSDRCDVFGSEGQCAPLLPEGVPCTKHWNCEGDLRCLNLDGSGLQCSVPPATPTQVPTLSPTATPTRTVATQPTPTVPPSSTATSAPTSTSPPTPTPTADPGSSGGDGCGVLPVSNTGGALPLLVWLVVLLVVRRRAVVYRV